MRAITWQCALKTLDAQSKGHPINEVERLLSVLFCFFTPQGHEPRESLSRNLRLERTVVQPLIEISLRDTRITEWLEDCQEIPLIYIDFPCNAWMISETVQVQAIFVDNGIGSPEDVMLFLDDEPRSTVTVLLAPKSTRSKRRLVWAMGTNEVHDELEGGTPDDQAGIVPSTLDLVATSGLSIPEFCRRIEGVIAAVLFQQHSLRAAMMTAVYAGGLPADPVRRAVYMRQYNKVDRSAVEREEVRSLFRIERIGLVAEGAQRLMPKEAVVSRHGPLLCPVWVRGHYRNQKYGAGLGQTKQIWIGAHRKGPEEGEFLHPMNLIGRAP